MTDPETTSHHGPLKAPLVAALVALCWLVAACGVPLQSEPEVVQLPTSDAQGVPPPEGGLTATIFLADDARLVPVERSTSVLSPRVTLSLLVEGPTAAEAEAGLRSALVPGSLESTTLTRGPTIRGRVADVAVTDSFTSTAGDDQLLATAQLVWTVTGGSSARWVRVVVAGDPIELPTDTGLTDQPVSRADYRSVAPFRVVSADPLSLDWLTRGSDSAPGRPPERLQSDAGTAG